MFWTKHLLSLLSLLNNRGSPEWRCDYDLNCRFSLGIESEREFFKLHYYLYSIFVQIYIHWKRFVVIVRIIINFWLIISAFFRTIRSLVSWSRGLLSISCKDRGFWVIFFDCHSNPFSVLAIVIKVINKSNCNNCNNCNKW